MGVVQSTKRLPLWTDRWVVERVFRYPCQSSHCLVCSTSFRREGPFNGWRNSSSHSQARFCYWRLWVELCSFLVTVNSIAEWNRRPGPVYWAAPLPGCGGREVHRAAVWLAVVWSSAWQHPHRQVSCMWCLWAKKEPISRLIHCSLRRYHISAKRRVVLDISQRKVFQDFEIRGL